MWVLCQRKGNAGWDKFFWRMGAEVYVCVVFGGWGRWTVGF